MERAAPKLPSGRARSTRRGVTSASEAPAAETTKRRRHGGTHLWYGFALLLVFGALQVYILVQSHTHSGLNVQAYLRTLFVARRPPSSPVVTVPSLPPSQADSPDSEEGEAEEQAAQPPRAARDREKAATTSGPSEMAMPAGIGIGEYGDDAMGAADSAVAASSSDTSQQQPQPTRPSPPHPVLLPLLALPLPPPGSRSRRSRRRRYYYVRRRRRRRHRQPSPSWDSNGVSSRVPARENTRGLGSHRDWPSAPGRR